MLYKTAIFFISQSTAQALFTKTVYLIVQGVLIVGKHLFVALIRYLSISLNNVKAFVN